MKNHLYFYGVVFLALCVGGPFFLRALQDHSDSLSQPAQVILLLAYAWAGVAAFFLVTVEAEAVWKSNDKEDWRR